MGAPGAGGADRQDGGHRRPRPHRRRGGAAGAGVRHARDRLPAARRPPAWLINVSRGRVIDEDALVRALTQGAIAGACLDVFREEPLPETSALWSLPNVIVTPHNSGRSPLNMERATEIFVDNLGRFVAGRPLRNRVRLRDL
ncbi:MAG: oxidoreductase [Chloroflexi bacterium]|nr:oxidoreductase [Chloroflexota bacterium]